MTVCDTNLDDYPYIFKMLIPLVSEVLYFMHLLHFTSAFHLFILALPIITWASCLRFCFLSSFIDFHDLPVLCMDGSWLSSAPTPFLRPIPMFSKFLFSSVASITMTLKFKRIFWIIKCHVEQSLLFIPYFINLFPMPPNLKTSKVTSLVFSV